MQEKNKIQDGKKKDFDEAFAPYNFVELNERVVHRYDYAKELPSHGKYYRDLLNGYITYKIRNNTPLIIKGMSDEKKENLGSIKNEKDDYIIPGSTIKGLIRSNMTILGLGSVESEVEDSRFMYRTIAGKLKKLKREYSNRVGLVGKSLKGVKCGYIYRVAENDYRIIPSKEEKYFRVNEKEIKEKWKSIKGIQFMYEDINCRVKNDNYEPYYEKVEYEVNKQNETVRNLKSYTEGNSFGYLMCAAFMNKKKTHYLITEMDESKREEKIPKEAIDEYNKDLKETKKSKFYNLPEEYGRKNAKPVFFKEYNKRLYFGFVPYLRIFYDKTVKNGLPEAHKSFNKIDYTKALMGFIDDNDSGYKGRVFIEDARITKNTKLYESYTFVLGSPKATCLINYLEQPSANIEESIKTYNDDNFSIRGIKQYWLKKNAIVEVKQDKDKEENKKIQSEIKPLSTGCEFEGRIYFENLHEDELGLLIWSLRLNENCQQNIGTGKPYGFGRIEIKDLELQIENLDKKYNSFSKAKEFHELKDYNIYINKYKDYMKNKKIDIDGISSIKEFFNIKSNIVDGNLEKYKYMDVKQFTKRGALPRINKVLEIRESNSQYKIETKFKLKCQKCGDTFEANEAQRKYLINNNICRCSKCRK